MDKYTVDLDKVLNDFEYSELTDQYNISRQQNDNHPFATGSQTLDNLHSKIKDTNVKHSINNVFHSLNEYLNSDINVKSYEPNLNGNSNNTNVKVAKEPLSSTLNYYPAVTVTTVTAKVNENLSNSKSSDISDIKIDNDLKTAVDAEENVKLVDISKNGSTSSEDTNNSINDSIEDTNCSNTSDSLLDTTEESVADKQEVVQEVKSDVINNLIETYTETNFIPINHVITVQENLTNNVDADITEKTDEYEKAEETVDVVQDNFKNERECAIEHNIAEEKEETVVKEEVKPEPVKAVGFDESYELDEDEASKLLEELENETEDTREKEQPSIQEELKVAEEISVIESNNENEIEKTDQKEVMPNAAEPEADISINESASDIKNNGVSEAETESENNSTLSRPNTLELNTNSEVITVNLIGDPGSTPYNNVYITNTLDTDNLQNDTGTASSLSPTVSEISTDSPNTSESSDLMPAPCNQNAGEMGQGDVGADMPNNVSSSNGEELSEMPENSENAEGDWKPGKTAPFWTPDSESSCCQHCDIKFTVIKRRHHCRACGLVLCSKCCSMKFKLEYLDAEARVCFKCYDILSTNSSSGSDSSPVNGGGSPHSQPNPNNPMEYCSVIPPLQQVENRNQTPPTVMVPVGVLKRKGSAKKGTTKSVMFCDGIRPGSDLSELDHDASYQETRTANVNKKQAVAGGAAGNGTGQQHHAKSNKNVPKMDAKTMSYIPSDSNSLPPTVTIFKSDYSYTDCANTNNVVEMLKNEPLIFALQRNLYVHLKIINMDCCVNKFAWCFTTDGMITVGQDEIVILLEFMENESAVPKDVFLHLNNIYCDALKGSSISEYGISIHNTSNFLDSKNHAGFLYIRPSFQCLRNVIIPKEPYLIGILIHRWETPWAKIFPLRLVLRLGAEYRYYPSPIISTRHRDSVYVEIGHTIINLLADFRNFSYTLPNIRGLTIHMEEKNTTVTIPMNRYDQILKSLNNSTDHILSFAGNFSSKADTHLVCIQDTHGNNENAYTTHAINIHNKPRKVTGASFIVFNGALKSSSGLTAKSSIIEDGLMIQILPEHMVQLRESLRNMKDHTIYCGCANAKSDETVTIVWGENDSAFNVGVKSPIDNHPFDGVPSIRVHNGKDFICSSGNKMVRWTEVFIMQNGEDGACSQEPVDISKLAESISKASSQALVKYLDLLAANNFNKVGVRTTLHVENVSYMAGSNGVKLPPIYMKSLDDELIPVLHRITSNNLGDNAIILELIFHVLNV